MNCHKTAACITYPAAGEICFVSGLLQFLHLTPSIFSPSPFSYSSSRNLDCVRVMNTRSEERVDLERRGDGGEKERQGAKRGYDCP